jgi:hypothetical protein
LALVLRRKNMTLHDRDREGHALLFNNCTLDLDHHRFSVTDVRNAPVVGGTLFFFPDTLEGLFVGRFYIHKTSCISIPLNPVSRGRTGLGAVPDGTISVSVAFRGICSHNQ